MRADATERRFNQNMAATEGRRSISGTTHQIDHHQSRRFIARNATTRVPDLTDMMNDVFFGTNGRSGGGDDRRPNKSYGLSDGERDSIEYDFDSSMRSNSSRMTQEWLEDAKRMVASSSSPSRGNGGSPVRLVGSPRFAQGRLSVSSLDKRDPLSRSARRHRAPEGISGEILSRTAMHQTGKSPDPFIITDPSRPNESSLTPTSPDNLKIAGKINFDPPVSPDRHNGRPPSPNSPVGSTRFPPRQSIHRRTRFQADSSPNLNRTHEAPSNLITERHFKDLSSPDNNSAASRTILDGEMLSPPKNLVESAHRRSISSGTCSMPLSPPRNLIESAQRRSMSSNTCSKDIVAREEKSANDEGLGDVVKGTTEDLNAFLKEQRVKIEKLLNGEINGKAKIVLSGPSNSTSSMVAATCYAWLLENRMRAKTKGGDEARNKNSNITEFVVPVMNIRRGKMWRQRQAAWLFYHVGLDATSLLFSNEVELETLMMNKQLSLLVVGEDILKTNGEVRSSCTVLTDNYCEDSYELLQTPMVKKLLLAGILSDTKNLSNSPKLSKTRDAEAVQLLSASYSPNYRNTIFDQLMQDQRDEEFIEAMRRTYGKQPPGERNGTSNDLPPSNDGNRKQSGSSDVRAKKISPVEGKPTTASPVPVQEKPVEASRGKNRNFFAKLFGFGSK